MKKVAVFKLIIWSVVGIFFASLFVRLISGEYEKLIPFAQILPWEEELQISSEHKFQADLVDSLDFRVTTAKIQIIPSEGRYVIITTRTREDRMHEKDRFHIDNRDATLFIEQELTRNRFPFLNFGWLTRDTIEIRLPEKEYNEIRATISSGSVLINDINSREIDIRATSGSIIFERVVSDELVIDLTFGSVDIEGEFEAIDAKMTSGRLEIESVTAPYNLFVDITSGNAKITLPENDGFTARVNRTSGTFSTDFILDDYGVYKSGERRYDINLTSGTFSLRRK